MPIDAAQFRATLALRAGGVAIVTARDGELVHGMTVTDFCGVSLAPPLVLVCADKQSHTLPVIERGRNFAVNLLAAGQQELSDRFASKQHEWTRFEGLACETSATGAPLIPGALASLACGVVALHDAGDHVIVVGQVEEVQRAAAAPLVHWSGGYRELEPGAS
jgi:3-hydroxy-9,10-secoandrosta-1,3,5(10)-triene-9,17-dione monooxygenase reductase component